jgi:hypothetical protein
MSYIGKIHLEEVAPNHPFVSGCIMFVPKPQNLGEFNQPIVLDRHELNVSPHKLVGIEPVMKPKGSPSLRLKTPEWTRIDPPWWQIEFAVRSCQGEMDGGFGEFCVLSQLGANTYVQTAVCLGKSPDEKIAWRIEWRITESDGAYTHYFARNPSDNEDAETVENIEMVLMAFKAFYQNKVQPDSLTWKRYDI